MLIIVISNNTRENELRARCIFNNREDFNNRNLSKMLTKRLALHSCAIRSEFCMHSNIFVQSLYLWSINGYCIILVMYDVCMYVLYEYVCMMIRIYFWGVWDHNDCYLNLDNWSSKRFFWFLFFFFFCRFCMYGRGYTGTRGPEQVGTQTHHSALIRLIQQLLRSIRLEGNSYDGACINKQEISVW